jgi:dienelactone hydrolase
MPVALDHLHRGAVIACLILLASCTSADGDDTTPSSATGPTPPTAPAALAIETTTWDHGRMTLRDGAVTEDWGVVAAPTATGPFPVAVVLHGNHPTCPTDTGEGRTWPCPAGTEAANHEGLTYLVEALARRGFVAVAPGINVQYTFGAGEPAAATRTAEIVDRVLDSLADSHLGVPPAEIDMERLVLVGHSVGGQDAGILAAGRTTFDRPVAGVVMLQPALNDAKALPLVDVPVAVVVSGCDGDTGVTGGRYITEALLTTRDTPAAVVVLERANHNFTNTGLRADAFPVESPQCTDGNAMAANEQQDVLAEIVPELAHAVLTDGDGAGWAGDVFGDPAPPAGVQLGVVRPRHPVTAVPGAGPSTPDGLTVDGLSATFCPIGYYTPFVEPGTEACHRPELAQFVGLPQTLAVSWTAGGASLSMPLDAAPGASIVVRALADPADPNLTGDTVRLRITTPEGLDSVWELPIPAFAREEIPPFTVTNALVMWSTLELTAPDGASEVTITVEAPAAGSIQIVSLGTAQT